MKLRAFAILAALAVPGLASATPADNPPTNTPNNNSPTNNSPSNHPAGTTPDKSPSQGTSPSDTSSNKSAGNDTKTDTKTDAKTGAKLSDGDTRTMAHLHHVNQMEITLGKEAQRQGTAKVKDYASTLITDHQSVDKDLTAFAKAHKLTAIPADKPMSDAERQDDKDMTQAMTRLKTLKGADFDKAYLTMMASDHDKELTKIDVAISSASDPDFKNLLQGVKPVLQRHADQARDLMKSPQASADQPGKALPSMQQH
jgi:putative membrane protein